MPDAAFDITKPPFFSVVIPTYNRAEKLRRALESLLHQSYGDFEVLVCDDGSTDGTREVVSAYAGELQISYLWEENWGGPARPRNRGIAAAQGKWVCFLDADDWWHPDKLAKVHGLAESADLIYHDATIVTPGGSRLIAKRGRQLATPVFVDLLTSGCRIVTTSVCVRKELLERSGGFAEELELVAIEDYDLWLRLALLTERFLYLPDSLASYWCDDANISTFSDRYIARETLLLQRYRHRLNDDDRKDADAVLSYKIGVALHHLGRFPAARQNLIAALGAKRLKFKLYALLYCLLGLFHCRVTIP